MSNSSLITRTDWAYSGNYTKGRNQKLRGIVIHHACATTIDSVARTFQTVGRNGSAHYCVCDDQISLMVDEANTAWHCSNWNGNNRTIGIEVCNKNLAPNYDISEKSFNTLVRLVADIANRNGFGKLQYLPDGDGTGITGHKDWKGASTSCPGQLYPRLAEIAQKANDINYPPKPTWVAMDEPREMVTKNNATLLELPSMNIVKTYKAGDKIPFKTKTTFNGVLYLRSDYSTNMKMDRGFPYDQLEEIPKPEPTPEPTPTPEPEPTPEPTPDPDDGDDTPNWFIRFIKKLAEFLANLFVKKEK